MALSPSVIKKGLIVEFARQMVLFLAARSTNPGIMGAALGIDSKSAYEEMGWIGAVPGVQEWIGEINAKEMADYDYAIKNKDWVAATPVNQNDLDDDNTGVISTIPASLVKRIMVHPEKLVFELLTSGTTGLAYDGVAFFSDVSGKRTFDNLLAGTGTSLAQLQTDLNAAAIAMAKFTDDQGESLNIRGNVIVCPLALENLFKTLVNSTTDPVLTGLGTYNAYSGYTVIGDARLDAVDANDWYLLATNEIMKPFVYSIRQTAKPDFEKKANTKTWIASANYRGNVGYGLPHLAIKTVNG